MDTLYNIIFSALDGMLVVFFLHGFLNKQGLGLEELITFLAVSIVGLMAVGNTANNMLWTVIGFCVYMVYAFWICNGHKMKAIIGSFLIFALLGIVSMIVVFATSVMLEKSLKETQVLYQGAFLIYGILFAKILLSLVILVILKLVKSYTISYLNKIEWCFITVVFFLLAAVLFILFYTIFSIDVPDGIMQIYSLCSIIMFCFVGSIIGILLRMNFLNRERLEFQRKMVLFETQEKNMAELKEEYKHVRCVKHDLRHYLAMAINMIENGKYETALDYMKNDVGNKIENLIQMVNTENDVIDAILNSKMLYAKQLGVKLRLRLYSTWQFEKESDMDVGIILANLLDNAILAAEKTVERKVEIMSQNKNEFLEITIKNNYSKEYEYEKSKKKTDDHGWGLVSVEDLIKKLGSDIEVKKEEDIYQVRLLLKQKMTI